MCLLVRLHVEVECCDDEDDDLHGHREKERPEVVEGDNSRAEYRNLVEALAQNQEDEVERVEGRQNCDDRDDLFLPAQTEERRNQEAAEVVDPQDELVRGLALCRREG